MALANDVLTSAARLAGMLADGETLQGNLASNMLTILQDMVDHWNADGLKISMENILTFPLQIGKQSYLLGPTVSAPDFQATRPAKIQRAGMLLTGSNPTQPPEIPISVLDYEGWSNIRVKSVTGNYPLNVYPDYNFPNMTLYFYQIPGLACSVVLYAWNPIATFPDLNTTNVTYPPAYARAIKYNLAVAFMAEYKLPPDQLVMGIAQQALTDLKDINLPSPIMTCDSGLTGRQGYWDWRSGEYVDRR
jgi:hypothetical protein